MRALLLLATSALFAQEPVGITWEKYAIRRGFDTEFGVMVHVTGDESVRAWEVCVRWNRKFLGESPMQSSCGIVTRERPTFITVTGGGEYRIIVEAWGLVSNPYVVTEEVQ